MSTIDIRAVSKSYGATAVLRSIDLTVPEGAITAVLGASGSGKTTLLRIIAGFEDADAGTVTMGGRLVDDGRRTVRPQHRGVGYVPQDAALFPHLTVAANIGFGVGRRDRAAIADLIDLVGLTGFESRYPHQLSGGQQQRVALARALAIRPQVVLLDEPFGSLDAALRESVRADVAAVLAQTGTTTVLVTHDQDEALSLADHVALLDDGAILAHGRPRDLYEHPPNPRVAVAIGTANVMTGRVADGRVHCVLGDLGIVGDLGVIGGAGSQSDPASTCQVLLRPEHIVVNSEDRPGSVAATIERIRYHGHDTLIDLFLDAPDRTALVSRMAGEPDLRRGQSVWLTTSAPPHVWF